MYFSVMWLQMYSLYNICKDTYLYSFILHEKPYIYNTQWSKTIEYLIWPILYLVSYHILIRYLGKLCIYSNPCDYINICWYCSITYLVMLMMFYEVRLIWVSWASSFILSHFINNLAVRTYAGCSIASNHQFLKNICLSVEYSNISDISPWQIYTYITELTGYFSSSLPNYCSMALCIQHTHTHARACAYG